MPRKRRDRAEDLNLSMLLLELACERLAAGLYKPGTPRRHVNLMASRMKLAAIAVTIAPPDDRPTGEDVT